MGWRKRYCSGLILAVLILGLSSNPGAEAAWTLKKAVGNHWRNGSNLIAMSLGRSHAVIKGLLGTMETAFQERYKSICEQFADAHEAMVLGAPNPTVIENKMKALKDEAAVMIKQMLGPTLGDIDAAPGGEESAVLDPMRQQLMDLQKRQMRQQESLLMQLKTQQEQERVLMEKQLAQAREQHMAVVQESHLIVGVLASSRKNVHDIQTRVKSLLEESGAIDSLSNRVSSAISFIQQLGVSPEGPLIVPTNFAQLEGEGHQIKARIGLSLGELNKSLQEVVEKVKGAEERSNTLSSLGPNTRSVTEKHLQECAALKVLIKSVEGVVRDTVTELENRQVTCDSLIARMNELLRVFLERYSTESAAKGKKLASTVSESAKNIATAVEGSAQALLQQISAEITRTDGAIVNWQSVGITIKQLLSQFEVWNQNMVQAFNSLDGMLDSLQAFMSSVKSLPEMYHGSPETELIQSAIAVVNNVKSTIRQHRAQVHQSLEVLKTSYRQGIQQLNAAVTQQQRNHVQPDIYSMYGAQYEGMPNIYRPSNPGQTMQFGGLGPLGLQRQNL